MSRNGASLNASEPYLLTQVLEVNGDVKTVLEGPFIAAEALDAGDIVLASLETGRIERATADLVSPSSRKHSSAQMGMMEHAARKGAPVARILVANIRR